jgi:thiol-disulfide isomerase/thioredoxin
MCPNLASGPDKGLSTGSTFLTILFCLAVHAPVFASDDSFKRLKIGPAPAGTVAAPFEMPALDGPHVASKELAGKVVLLNFWATWCGPCKDEMPAIERLRKSLDPDKVAVLTVTTDLQQDGIRHFLRHLHVHLPVLFDEDQEVSRAYMVRALPTTVIIDRGGHVLGKAVGPRNWDSPEAVELMQRLTDHSR